VKAFLGLLHFTLSITVFAHPGGGIIALSDNSVVIADSVENFIWHLEKAREPRRLVSKFHGHWLTRGLDGHVYAEAFGESGGAWSSAAFRVDMSTGMLTEIAHRNELRALVFAVDRDGSLVFNRGGSIVSRKNGMESPFRSVSDGPKLDDVTAYFWSRDDELIFADRNRVHRINPKGVSSVIAEIEGKVLEPKIWNATDTPSVFGIAVDDAGRVLAAVPGLAKVYRIEKNQAPKVIARGEDGWRATGVAVFGESIFLLESDARASTSPRVRILRSNGTVELLTVSVRSK
jgi:hypothetical protein